jgi:hypothetical protein
MRLLYKYVQLIWEIFTIGLRWVTIGKRKRNVIRRHRQKAHEVHYLIDSYYANNSISGMNDHNRRMKFIRSIKNNIFFNIMINMDIYELVMKLDELIILYKGDIPPLRDIHRCEIIKNLLN